MGEWTAFAALVALAIGLFVSTDLDDISVFVGFFPDPTFKPRQIAIGQMLGIGEAVMNVWRLWELSNKGFYLAPICMEKLRLGPTDLLFDELVQADTAGLIVTLLSADWQLSALSAPSSMHQVMRLERALKCFAEMHPEAREIFNVID